MLCVNCGGKLKETDGPIFENIKGVEISVSGIPHWECEECGDFEISVNQADMLLKKQVIAYIDKCKPCLKKLCDALNKHGILYDFDLDTETIQWVCDPDCFTASELNDQFLRVTLCTTASLTPDQVISIMEYK